MKTRRTLATLVVAVLLGGCGDDAAITNAVKEQLKDPGSAQFKKVTISQSGQLACVVWNAKNSLGGYDDWKTATLEKGLHNSSWKIENLDVAAFNCNKSDLDKLAELKLHVRRMSLRFDKEEERKATKIAAKKGVTYADVDRMTLVADSACGPEYRDIAIQLHDANIAIKKGSLDNARAIADALSQRIVNFEKATCHN